LALYANAGGTTGFAKMYALQISLIMAFAPRQLFGGATVLTLLVE
jgi:hypothetical protein